MSSKHPEPIRALLDANILVSILISPDPEKSAAAEILTLAEAKASAPVIPKEVLDEVRRVVASKPWLADRIPAEAVESLTAALGQVAEFAPTLPEPPPRITRDPGDDFLLAQAVLSGVEYLVTRDRDLLSLGEFAGVSIVEPATFLGVLRSLP